VTPIEKCVSPMRRLLPVPFIQSFGRPSLNTNLPLLFCSPTNRASLAYNFLIMIPKDLLDILVCPVCKKPLVLKENGESLKCGECHRVYPIRDDIPILLIDESVTDPS
jgi:uncharacterized protein